MAGRTPMVVLVAVTLTAAVSAPAEMRVALNRPEIIDIGDPTLIDRALLALEMERNVDLKTYIGLYGEPEYAEVQEIQIAEPFAPYEVRLYYLRRNLYLAFGRVNVAPSVRDYGVKKFEGPINPETVARLLTARAAETEQPASVEPEVVSVSDEAVGAELPAVEGVESEVVEVDEPASDLPVASVDQGVMDALVRMEAAADRAALAAGVAERASLAAVASADQATATLEALIAGRVE